MKIFHPALAFVAAGLLFSAIPIRSEPVTLTRNGNSVEVSIGGQLFITFHFESEYDKAPMRVEFPMRNIGWIGS
jgi:hypothetical protein